MEQKPTDTDPPSSVNPTPDPARKPYLGGADSVGKTTYLGDVHGTDVNDAPHPAAGVNATVKHRGGLGPLGWILLVAAALVAAAYAAGFFT
jgi:hypothetical protein